MFDSFSTFGKPISNQTKLPDNLPFGSIHNTTVGKILEIQITVISDEGSRGERCSCCRSPLFVAVKIPDLHSCVAYGIDLLFLSSIRVYFV